MSAAQKNLRNYMRQNCVSDEKSLGNKGALLYSPDGSMCALRGRQPGRLNVRAVLRRVAPCKGVPPLRCHSSYPSALCSGNILLSQTISAAKPENPISLPRPSTENVGGLFASNFNSQEVEIMHEREIEKLQAEKEKVERQLAQEQHKIQRLENRAAY